MVVSQGAGLAVLAGILAGGPVCASGPASVKLQLIEGRPVVDGVYVNGSGPYRFVVDTGSSVNLLDPKLAQSIGLTPTFRHQLGSAAGFAPTPGRGDVEIRLDSAVADKQTFLFPDLDFLRALSPAIKGVLGQSFLSRFDYLLDLRNKRLEFGSRESDGARTAFQTVNERPAVLTNLGLMLLDSGTDRVVLFGLESGGELRLETVAGPVGVGTVSGRPISIDGRTIRYSQALTVSRRIEQADTAGLLPVILFRAVYVCNSGRYVVLE